MDVLYEKGEATVAEVVESLPDPPSYSAVRAALATLETKGSIRHEKKGAKFVFTPKTSAETARRSAIRHLIQTFFRGSREQAVAALLEVSPAQLSEEELDRLSGLIEKARQGVKR